MMYMLNESGGCILGDEMGLGKTLQVIAVILEYKHQCKTPVLVIAPVSLLQNWKRECEKFAPELRVAIHHGPSRTGRYKELQKNDVVIMSYSAVVTDNSLLTMIHWKLVVLDEAQNTTPAQMKMFLTRIGFGSKAVITGDASQIDLPRGQRSGLIEASHILQDVRGVSMTYFTSADVVRHPLVARIVEAYQKAEKREYQHA